MALNSQQIAQEQAMESQAGLIENLQRIVKNPGDALNQMKAQGIDPTQFINQIQKFAKSENKQIAGLATQALSSIQQFIQMQPQTAKNGTKLQYIKRLRGECPDGFELQSFKAGGTICYKCKKKIEEDKCGGKMKKHAEGGEAPLISEFKSKRKK